MNVSNRNFRRMSRSGVFICLMFYASDFYFCEQQHNYISTLAYMRMINDLLPLEIENYELAFAAFVLLHEYGHWLHFRRCHKSGLDYVLWLNKFLAPGGAATRDFGFVAQHRASKRSIGGRAY